MDPVSEPLRQARRAHAALPCRSTADRLDAELRRSGDGPHLPVLLNDAARWTVDLSLWPVSFLMRAVHARLLSNVGLGALPCSPDADGTITLSMGDRQRRVDVRTLPPNVWTTV